MCDLFRRQPAVRPVQQAIAAPDNAEAVRRGNMEARLRRMRAGAAANILTGPSGIPAGAAPTMGGNA